ncbi:MAG: hypothetical protein ACK4RM_10580 [Flavobacterium sp.]
MKTTKFVLFFALSMLITSCANTAKFPVSGSVPAADITAQKKQDKNNNFTIEVTAKNLADAQRLNPPRNNYSVWIVTEDGITKNIGQLSNRNARTAVLKAVTPFNFREIFVTAENQGDLTFPSGTEISRTRFKK